MNVQELIDLAEALRVKFGPVTFELPDPSYTDSPPYDYHPPDGGDGGGDGDGDGGGDG